MKVRNVAQALVAQTHQYVAGLQTRRRRGTILHVHHQYATLWHVECLALLW